ncbi:MAG: hypothetical protein N3A65_01775 [candidate division WOR-3 bacterium]|nr:hypothetical protein [candidate division WOR-3 bacterium]
MVKQSLWYITLGTTILFGINEDLKAPGNGLEHVFKLQKNSHNISHYVRTGNPVLVDTIDLSPINPYGYCWGLAYDWERDALWVTQWSSAFNKMYAIEKRSPCTKIDSVTLVSGLPPYRLGIGYGGNNIMFMAGNDYTIYRIDMNSGTGSVYRTLPCKLQGLDFNIVNDGVYGTDIEASVVGYALPSQNGAWRTWMVPRYPSGVSGAYSATMPPKWIFQVEANTPAYFYQYRLSYGVPVVTPESIWICDSGQTQGNEADCAFDGRYVYILDQSGPDKIWVYDVRITLNDTIRWTFESGWQGWQHTSPYAFPNAWGIAVSNLHPGWMPPNAQNYCLWFDDDAAGSGAPPLRDTAQSPLIVPHTTTNWLKWSIAYNFCSGSEYLEVGIKYLEDTVWRIVPLKVYNYDIFGRWDSADVSPYKIYPRLQIYFYYDDGGDWQWYGAIDNVTINGELYVPALDVGAISINQPPANVLPNTTYNPEARFKNFGNRHETFNVFFQIDSSGIIIYNQTYNIGLNGGDDTVITFSNWRSCGTTGVRYLFRAFTTLSGDLNPANDTVTKVGIVNPTYWEVLSAQFPSPSSGHSMATLHDGKYMVFGVNTTAGYTNQTWIYDISTGVWIAGPNNPYGCGAYGTAQGVNGKYYRIGGTDAWPVPLARVDIYNPISNQWSNGANCPIANMDMVSGVYKDSLIFTFGGGNWGGTVAPHNRVYFYDTYLNSWTQATGFPGVGRGCAAGGIIDTFAIVACGYDGSLFYRNDYIVGRINPNNCAQITWNPPATIPGMAGRYRVPSGIDIVNKELWIVCGQISGGTSDETWSYNPYTNTWTNWNKPKPHPVGNVSPIVVTRTATGDVGVFIASGYYGITNIPDHEVFHTGHIPGVQEKPWIPVTRFRFGFNPGMQNPIKDYTAITYTTTKSGSVILKVHDATGRSVRTLVNRPCEPAGTKTVYWDCKDENHRKVAPGVYFLRLESENMVATHKMILLE